MANTCCVELMNMLTKYEVFIFNPSKDNEGVPKSPYLLIQFAMRMRCIM